MMCSPSSRQRKSKNNSMYYKRHPVIVVQDAFVYLYKKIQVQALSMALFACARIDNHKGAQDYLQRFACAGGDKSVRGNA